MKNCTLANAALAVSCIVLAFIAWRQSDMIINLQQERGRLEQKVDFWRTRSDAQASALDEMRRSASAE